MQLTDNEKSIVETILSNVSGEIYLFGSRVRGTARPDSDLDVCIKRSVSEVPLETISELREKFSNSNLPFAVDLVDYQHLNTSFRDAIALEWVPLNAVKAAEPKAD
jgi:uncharacterized protein